MKISNLDTPYKELAMLRKKMQNATSDRLLSGKCFDWNLTPEGEAFWDKVSQGAHPMLPEISKVQLGIQEVAIRPQVLEAIENKILKRIDELRARKPFDAEQADWLHKLLKWRV